MNILLNKEPLDFDDVKLNFYATTYIDDSLAIYCETEAGEPWQMITVNLRDYGIIPSHGWVAINHDVLPELKDLFYETFCCNSSRIAYGYAESSEFELKQEYIDMIFSKYTYEELINLLELAMQGLVEDDYDSAIEYFKDTMGLTNSEIDKFGIKLY